MSEIEKSFNSDKFTATYPVQPENEGWRLDQFIQKWMPTLSRQFLKKKIDKGEVIISGRLPPHKPSTKVHYGEKVTIMTFNDGQIEEEFWLGKIIPKDEKPTIIFEDQDMLIVNKPPFMITHPAGKNLFYCATVFFETLYKKTIHSIHRLDRETSGVLLLGKNPRISQKISLLFEENKVKKCYFLIARKNAITTPFPFTAKERMDREEGSIPRGIMSWYPEDSHLGKEAQTHFEKLWENEDYVLALAFPVTGRQHQIRLHAACHGYPLLGDKLYNGDVEIFIRFKDHLATAQDHEKMQLPRQALHAVGLLIGYPETVPTLYSAPLPVDLLTWMETRLNLSKNFIEEMIHITLKNKLRLS